MNAEVNSNQACVIAVSKSFLTNSFGIIIIIWNVFAAICVELALDCFSIMIGSKGRAEKQLTLS